MIDSANIDVIRKNIQDLAKAQDPNRIADVEYQVGELENVVGSTPLTEGMTLTNMVSRLSTNGDNTFRFTLGSDGIMTLTLYYSGSNDDRATLQVNPSQNKLRFVQYSSGTKAYDKSVTLS